MKSISLWVLILTIACVPFFSHAATVPAATATNYLYTALGNLRSVTFNGTGSYISTSKYKDQKEQFSKTAVTHKGRVTIQPLGPLAFEESLTVTSTGNSGFSFLPEKFTLDLKVLNNTGYIRASFAPNPLAPSMISWFVPNASTYLNKWFRISFPELATFINNEAKKQKASVAWTEPIRTMNQTLGQIHRLYLASRPVILVANLGSETVNGVATTRYSYRLDPKATERFITAFYKDIIKKPLDADDLARLREAMKEQPASTGTIWLGADWLPYKISTAYTTTDNEPTYGYKSSQTVASTMFLSGHNQTTILTAPTPSENLLEVVKREMKGREQTEVIVVPGI